MLNSATITVITKALHKVARGIVRDFGEVDQLQISKKGTANFVTSADLRTEKILVEELKKARPRASFLTEESGVIDGPDKDYRFVIDPIDGTTNFIHAIPYLSVSIAAQRRDAKGVWHTEAGVVYDPLHDELFAAEKGQGAYVNNKRLRVSSRTEDVMLSTSSPRKWRDGGARLSMFQRAIEMGAIVRCSGSAALDLAYVAAGRLDGTFYLRLNSWDMAAGDLLVREAGGQSGAIEGGPISTERGSVVAAGPQLFDQLRGMLAEEAA